VLGDETTDVARDAFNLLSAEYPTARHVWWGGNHYAASAGLPDASCWLVWDKANGESDFADCELAWTNHPGAVRMLTHMWNGMLRASERGKRVHPTQKPCALAEWAFSVIDPKDERKTVLDVFGGSGSTLIAAHRTGRTAAIVEASPAYVDVIAARWEAETSVTPQLVRPDGTTEPVSFT
jgi:DNA modification methylase